jgi:hypothetical protein
MEHTDVVRLRAAEKYVLGELTPELREQFEEHYFDCPECAVDVQALTKFVTAGRQVFEEDAKSKAPSRIDRVERQGWLGWLRPVIAVPAMAALAAVVLFQAAVTIPHLKEQLAGQQTAQVYESSYRVQGVTRGQTVSKVTVAPNESFALDFDFTPSQTFPSYKGSLVDPAGQTVFGFDVSGAAANKELHLVIPGDQAKAGTYQLIFVGENGTQGSAPKNNEVQRLSFVVEIQSK